jgi:hypothetical protein
VPSRIAAGGFGLLFPKRSLALQDGRAVFLTGHSVEIWTTLPDSAAGTAAECAVSSTRRGRFSAH